MRRSSFVSYALLLILVCAVLQMSSTWSPFGSSGDGSHRSSGSVFPPSSPDATAVSSVKVLSSATTNLMQHAAQRKQRIELRRRNEEEQLPVSAKLSRFVKGVSKKVVGVEKIEEGLVEPPSDIADVIKVRTEHYTFTPEELLQRYKFMDIVYTWVNGSEYNHLFRKYYRRNQIRRRYLNGTGGADAAPAAAAVGRGRLRIAKQPGMMLEAPAEAEVRSHGNYSNRWVPFEPTHIFETLHDLESFLDANRNRFVNSRDRESDELRYSFRSLDQYVDWHHGRIIIVSPGHTPLWLDHSQNFFARSQRPIGHLRRRVIAVHQDAILPGNQRLTFNTNTIEQHIQKLKNLSNLFVQFNDDYFVNHPTSVTDFVNNKGGAILLHEGGEVRGAAVAYKQLKKIWLGGVYHSNSFNIRELEEVGPAYVPKYVADAVRHRMTPSSPLEVATTTNTVNTLARRLFEAQVTTQNFKLRGGRPIPRVVGPDGKELKEQIPKRKRYFLKHAPFVYCRRIFEHLAERYQRDFQAPAVANPHRNKEDLLMPFVHNAFIIDRPWAGSPNYLPQLIAINNLSNSDEITPITIHLDNEDGCAPALNKIGEAAKSLLVIFVDDLKENERRMERLADVNPIFFALNDGFSRAEAAQQLKRFMASKYPDKSVFEVHHVPSRALAGAAENINNPAGSNNGNDPQGASQVAAQAALEDRRDSGNTNGTSGDATTKKSFEELMELPLVVLVHAGDESIVCPLSRSLRLGMPEHHGKIIVVMLGAKEGSTSATAPIRHEGDAIPDRGTRLLTACAFDKDRVEFRFHAAEKIDDVSANGLVEQLVASHAPVTLRRSVIDLLPDHVSDAQSVKGFILDFRRSNEIGPFHLSMFGQTLALEDFVFLPPAQKDRDDRWLYLSPCPLRQQAARIAERQFASSGGKDAYIYDWRVNWIVGVSEEHLRHTFPVPYGRYEAANSIRFTHGTDKSW